MHRGKKVVLEEIDEAEMQFSRDEVECKGLLNRCKAEGRDVTAIENQRFNATVERVKQTKQRLVELRNELQEAEEFERRILTMNTPGSTIHQQSGRHPRELVLPTNGRLPSSQPRYQPYNRIGKLNCFRDEQSAYDSGQWLRAVICREFQHGINAEAENYCEQIGFQITNVGYEGSGPAGGYLVPPTISSAIIDLKERVGVSRQVCNVLPTGGDTLSVPKKSGGLTVYYPAEGALITDSDKSWSMVSLAVEKRAVASYLTNELVDDALINIVDNVITEMAYALALQEDNELINGTGASTYGHVQGLLAAIGAAGVYTAPSGHETWAELDIADFASTIAKLPDRFHVYQPSWICSHAFFNAVMVRLAYAAGGTTMAEIMSGTGNVRQFMGYPVYLTPHMPIATAVSTKSALFGAFNQAAILADRGGVRIGRSDEYKFLEDKVTLRATSRYDIFVHDHGDGSTAGAYVALATAAS